MSLWESIRHDLLVAIMLLLLNAAMVVLVWACGMILHQTHLDAVRYLAANPEQVAVTIVLKLSWLDYPIPIAKWTVWTMVLFGILYACVMTGILIHQSGFGRVRVEGCEP